MVLLCLHHKFKLVFEKCFTIFIDQASLSSLTVMMMKADRSERISHHIKELHCKYDKFAQSTPRLNLCLNQ